MRLGLITASLLMAVCIGSQAVAQSVSWQDQLTGASIESKRPQDVQYLFPDQVTVAAGRDSVIEMHFRVNHGMHINSHTPSQKWLIPTSLRMVPSPDLKLQQADFPAGGDYSLAAMPKIRLRVYTGDFVVRAHILAQPGQHVLQGTLRYQACDTNSCYPPREAPIAVDVIAK